MNYRDPARCIHAMRTHGICDACGDGRLDVESFGEMVDGVRARGLVTNQEVLNLMQAARKILAARPAPRKRARWTGRGWSRRGYARGRSR